jgi:hypothetical protein
MSEKHRCQKMIYGGSFHGRSCAKTAKHEHEGKWYGGTHHPPAVKARRVARDRGWNEKWARQDAERDRQSKIRQAENRVVEAALNMDYTMSDRNQEWAIPYGPEGAEFIESVAVLRELRGVSLAPESTD